MASIEIRNYRAKIDTVFAASQRAIRDLGYKIDAIDRANGLLNFKTGMSWLSWAGQEMSVMFVENGNGTIDVSISGRRNQNGVILQVYDWGEANNIARNVLAMVDKLVAEMPPPDEMVTHGEANTTSATRDECECPFCAEPILKKAKVCKHCGREVGPPPTVLNTAPQSKPPRYVIPSPGPNSDLQPTQIRIPETDDEFFASLGISDSLHQDSGEFNAESDSIGLRGTKQVDSEFAIACVCGARLRARTHLLGKTVRCPKCKKPLTIKHSEG